MHSFSWHSLTAILGGRFDPPHLGHREAAWGLFTVPGVAAVRIIPSADPPHKPARCAAETRFKLAQILFEVANAPGPVALDDRELHRAKRTGTPSYTFDTLQEFRSEGRSIAFVIGTDQLRDLPLWYRFPELLGSCSWIVLERAADPTRVGALARLGEWTTGGLLRSCSPANPNGAPEWEIARSSHRLILAPTPARALSSTEIRHSLATAGEPPADSLSSEVELYLRTHALYGTRPKTQS